MSDSAAVSIPVPLWRWMALAWLLIWVLSCVGFLSILCVVLVILLAMLAGLSRSWRPVLVLLASPFAFCFVMGSLRWFDAEPTLVGYGLPTSESFNLKRETRCYWRSIGCCIDGSEWVWLTPANCGLRLMCETFGWPPHSYHGAYPTQEEAVQLSESANSMPLKEFLSGKLQVQGREVLLGEKQTNRMVLESGGDVFEPEKSEGMEIRAVPAGDDCILVRLQHKGPDEDMDMIYLFDHRTTWPFARYEITGRGSHYPYFRSKVSF